MSRFWNKDMKQFVIIVTTILLLGMVLMNGIIWWFRGKIKSASREVTASMIGIVLENYPEIPQEQIIRCFQEEGVGHSMADKNMDLVRKNMQAGNEMLARYGILTDDFVMGKMGKDVSVFSGEINFVFVLVGGILITCFWCSGMPEIESFRRSVILWIKSARAIMEWISGTIRKTN